jgi:ABC-2 type transport system ATP-binding protein
VAEDTSRAVACLRVEGLTRGHGTVLANRDITLSVAAGEIFGILGPNGAGKTTLVRQLVGLLRPDSGRIMLFGRPLDRGLAGRAIAYLPQEDSALADIPVGLAVETTARLRGLSAPAARAARDGVLEELGLGAVAERAPVRLSGGQRRLAAVAAALAGERAVLVLDEPTTGLDPLARRAVWGALRARRDRGVTVLLVTHNVVEAESILDRVAVLDAGRLIACDTPGRLKAAVSGDLRLELVWRAEPPAYGPVAALAARATVSGRRWTVRLPAPEARAMLADLTSGPALEALDDFTLATPSLEDVYLALGGRADDWERE